jgi:hypothetical protein
MFTHHCTKNVLLIGAVLALTANCGDQIQAAPLEVNEGVVTTIGKLGFVVENPLDLTRREFVVNMNTKIRRNETLARFTDLRPGDTARITFRPIGNKLLALTIEALSPPPPAR